MRKEIALLLLPLLIGCTPAQDPGVQELSLLFRGQEQVVQKASVPLTDLIKDVNLGDPNGYVYTLKGDRSATITYDEFSRGRIVGNGLEFDGIICECADIKNLSGIEIYPAITVRNGQREWIATGDLATFIREYVTKTPEAYTYRVNASDPVALTDLSVDQRALVTMVRPEGAVEVMFNGEERSSLFTNTSLEEKIRKVVAKPEDYLYSQNGTWVELKDLADGDVVLARKVIYVDGEPKEVSVRDDTALAGLVGVENPSDFGYVLTSSGGFSPPPLSWEDFKEGVWHAKGQVADYPKLSAKYAVRDLESITLINGSASLVPDEIMIDDIVGRLTPIEYDGQRAVLLSSFIGIDHPETHEYKLIADDGYSPEPYSWDDMQQGYWLLDRKETLFPNKDIGKNRIRDLERIVIQ